MGPPKNGREINVGPKDNLLSHPNLGSRKNKERKIPRFGEDKRKGDDVIIMGGYGSFKTVTVFHPSAAEYDSSFTSKPNMLFPRAGFACVHFHSQKHGGRPVVLSAGGKGSSLGGSTAEILDYTEQDTWERSK